MKAVKIILKTIIILLLAAVVAVAGLVGYLTITEYRPAEREAVVCTPSGTEPVGEGDRLTVLTFNVGYGGLGAQQDFFMDGGATVRAEAADVEENLQGITEFLQEQNADVYFLQETDRNAKRSYYTDEAALFQEALGCSAAFAYNYKCGFVPYPLPFIGRVESGLLTLTDLTVSEAERVSLPVPFSWPVRTANLKRCLLIERVPVGTSGRELVLINLHLEAYDDGTGKAAQTRMLAELIAEEYEKGNYVIAGGDFNQTFPDALDRFPLLEDNTWKPGEIDAESFSGFGVLVSDDRCPTCRLLNTPYDPNTSQVYVLDGFIVSDNVRVEAVETLDCGFRYSDHNPVKLTVTLSA